MSHDDAVNKTLHQVAKTRLSDIHVRQSLALLLWAAVSVAGFIAGMVALYGFRDDTLHPILFSGSLALQLPVWHLLITSNQVKSLLRWMRANGW